MSIDLTPPEVKTSSFENRANRIYASSLGLGVDCVFEVLHADSRDWDLQSTIAQGSMKSTAFYKKLLRCCLITLIRTSTAAVIQMIIPPKEMPVAPMRDASKRS